MGTTFRSIAAGSSYTCGTVNGSTWCWGANSSGQLGNGSTADQPLPAQVSSIPEAISISVGVSHSCAVIPSGQVVQTYCWGANDAGQLGDGTVTDSKIPRLVFGNGLGLSSVFVGPRYTCASRDPIGVFCWGADLAGELADGSSNGSRTPRMVRGGESMVTITTGGTINGGHACAISAH